MNLSSIITGHNLLHPSAERAPLEFKNDPEILARCQSAVDAIKAKHTAGSVESELEAMGIQFVGGGK